MTLVNRGSVADALIGVESPAARKVEIHRSSSAGGVMSMQMEAKVTIPPGRSVRFEPGGLHLMLVGLAKPLKAGDKVPATLVFARGARLRTEFVVGVAAPQAMDGMPGH
jgi:copper(I)-binding protein